MIKSIHTRLTGAARPYNPSQEKLSWTCRRSLFLNNAKRYAAKNIKILSDDKGSATLNVLKKIVREGIPSREREFYSRTTYGHIIIKNKK